MKGLFAKRLAFTLLFLSGILYPAAHAQQPQLEVMHEAGSKRAHVYYQAAERQTVLLRILDAERRELYAQKIRDVREFTLPLNLAQLPAGSYRLQLKAGKWKQEAALELGAFRSPLRAEIIPDELRRRFVLKVAQPELKKVRVMIEDPTNELIYNELVELDAYGNRIFNLGQLRSGVVTVTVLDDQGSFVQKLLLP
ncbi:MAG: hypothetical protein D6730_10350 [Bacteroidetes bacterium]|nr:MAG: hypothetical protein D6730_10350 [Bacteroidota bacterium]